MKRVWIFVGAGLLLLLLFAWWYSQHESLTDELLAQIKLGMKKDQVEALLGKPENGYTLVTWRVSTHVMISPPLTLTPNNPWLATCEASGDFTRIEGNTDKPHSTPPLIWIGREKALVLSLTDSDGVCYFEAFPIRKTGGGFFAWISRKWDDWMQGK